MPFGTVKLEWIEIFVWGRSRSLKMARLDRPYMTFL